MERRSQIYPTLKPSLVVEWTLGCADRQGLRRAIAEKWSDEDAYTNYRYNVERCADGKRVYLLRPTWLNKGFDFQVNVEGLVKVVKPGKGATREMPSHGDVIHDLQSKVAKRPKEAKTLFEAVGAVYDCSEPRGLCDFSKSQRERGSELAALLTPPPSTAASTDGCTLLQHPKCGGVVALPTQPPGEAIEGLGLRGASPPRYRYPKRSGLTRSSSGSPWSSNTTFATSAAVSGASCTPLR